MRQSPLPRSRTEEGSTLPLTIFFGALALVLVLLVAAATSLYLERKRLFSLADGSALVGAEAFELADIGLGGEGPQVRLDDDAVAAAVRDYLADNQPDSLDSLVLERADSPDGHSARVTLSSFWRPPLLGLLLPEGLRIEVTSVARALFS